MKIFVARTGWGSNPFEEGVIAASQDIDKVRRAVEQHVNDPTWTWEPSADVYNGNNPRIPGQPDRWYVAPDGDQGMFVEDIDLI